ncbi:hypothetical protein EUZ85_16380 [Hahella sp. KA22]|uniref:hypothetical protein n=1 Tax=Hahella sp. KA22 TaxID=1628392 RepID=UPI000FDD8538|nr:hypothetical protein [Hahella sp. KA22]AZZ92214.1 hypothetical protein ENC22_13815 [Hahella sp. KA22]QAY55585.1 hypothetical protein EUZ85_16380 [Hahella sp. KA22]
MTIPYDAIHALKAEIENNIEAAVNASQADFAATLNTISRQTSPIYDFLNNEELWSDEIDWDIREALCKECFVAVENGLHVFCDALIAKANASDAFMQLLHEHMAHTEQDYRYYLFANMSDENTFSMLLDSLTQQLEVEDHDYRSAWLPTLRSWTQKAEYAERATEFLTSSFQRHFEYAKKARSEKLKSYGFTPSLYHETNNGLVGALAMEFTRYSIPNANDILLDVLKIVSDDDASYGLNCKTGPVAIALSLCGYAGDVSVLESFLESFEWRYEGAQFVMETRYALWMINRDADGAAAFLANPENTKNLSYAACAIADLDAKQYLPLVEQRCADIDKPVAKEAFKETITRLRDQTSAPAPSERMIYLFGETDRTVVLLGGDYSGEFYSRAKAASLGEAIIDFTEEDDDSADIF